MAKQGPGKVFLKQALTFELIGHGRLDMEVHVYNFDIDVPALKDEHTKFLHEKLVPALAANPDATVRLQGSASRTYEPAHNLELSGKRADAVHTLLTASGVAGRITKVEKLGEPATPGPAEDERDRAVFISASFPLTLTDIALWTDDWSRRLTWNEVVGIDATSATRFNLQLEARGAPRYWDLDSGRRALMPPRFRLKAERKDDSATERLWEVPQLPEASQPGDIWRTLYRMSGSAAQVHFGPMDPEQGVATVNRETVPISLKLEDRGWSHRGQAELGVTSSEPDERIEARKLLNSGGVDVLYLRGRGGALVLKRPVRNPATVFLYSGNGTSAGCLSQVGDCWADPRDLLPYWKGQSAMRVLILAAPWVLKMAITKGMAAGQPGAEWAKFLKSKGGPFTAILGYRGTAPDIKSVGAEIARKMGAKLAAGLKDDQLVRTWLDINARQSGKHTWNAVGMDQRGYSWIHERTWDEEIWDFFPGLGDKYEIRGPAVIT